MAIKVGDIGLRTASAVVLAPAAVLATWAGGVWFLALMILACVLLAAEWAMMSAPAAWRTVSVAVALGLIAGVVSAHFGVMSVAFVMLVFGTTSPASRTLWNRMRSAARPWWVGMTCLKPVRSRTTASKV